MVLALFLFFFAASPTFEESFRAGLLALQRNDLNAATTHLEAAAKMAPGNGRVWVALARTYWKLKQDGRANDAAAKAAGLGQRDALVLSSLAIYYGEAGQTLKAAEAQAKYSMLEPKDAAGREKAEALYFEAAQPLLQNQKFGEAIPILTQATERLPNSAQLELALGVAYYGLRRFDEAASAFLRTIAIAPEIERPYLFLGKFLGQIPSKLPEVTRQFVRYEDDHPDVSTGYLLHAKALNAQSIDSEAARKLLEKAIAMDEREPSGHFELGVVMERSQQYADAVREFSKAAELDPADPAAHYRLSRLYDRLGKSDEARRERELHARLVAAQEAVR